MNSVSVQIQRAINDAISSQVLPQIQNVLRAGSGHMTQKGWNVSTEGPEIDPEVLRSENSRNNLKSERVENRPNDEPADDAYDMVTGGNISPIQVPEFLTGRMPSRSHLNQSHDDLNPLLYTTIPAQDRIVPAVNSDPISRLADVLTSMQNRPTAQQLTIRPVNSNTMTFVGKSEKMQPEMFEQMKINHFHSLLKRNA